jgi:SMI1 / KNR4 family (SUKH-1)
MSDDLIPRIRQRADDPHTRTDSFGPGFPPRFPPASEATLADAERRLGFALPSSLAAVYVHVGNGGFGPGYGLIGLPGGYTGGENGSIVELYETRRNPDPSDTNWVWPEAVVPFCEWGCAIYSCVDCRLGSVQTFDPNALRPGEAISRAFARTHPTVAAWFEDWVNGVRFGDKMFERDPDGDRTITNPFTRQPAVIYGRRLRRQP